MTIQSTPTRVVLTGEDAAEFVRAMAESGPNPAAHAAVARGVPMARQLLANGSLRLSAEPRWRTMASAPRDRLVLFAAEFEGPGKWRVKMGGWHDAGRWFVMGASWVPTLWRDLPEGPVGVLEDYYD